MSVMYLVKSLNLLKYSYITTLVLKSASTKAIIKEQHTEKNHELEIYEHISKISIKPSKKRPQKPPFAKNIFLGVFDTDILAYPEVLDKEELDKLMKSVEPIEEYYSQSDLTPTLSSDFKDNAKRFKLFGLQVSQVFGGRELNITEACKFLEVITKNSSDTTLLSNEQLGIQLLKTANIDLQNKYFNILTSGKMLSAFCMSECIRQDPRFLQTKATYSAEENIWVLNGEKAFVINGNNADIFIVLAQTEDINKLGLKESKSTAFVVERSFGGITTKSTESLGLNSTDISTVTFNQTPVPAENVIGNLHFGDAVVANALTGARISVGPACITLTKQLLEKFTEHCKNNTNEHTNLATADIVHQKISEIASSVYAMESLTYLTTGLLDRYDKQDCELEAAIVKAFSAHHCLMSTLSVLKFLGAPAYMKNHWCNTLHTDALSYSTLVESVDSLKIIIALLGLQHAGINLQSTVNKIRNPLFHPGDMFKRMWSQRRQIEDNPKLTLQLADYLHPSATKAAQWLEYCVLRLQFGTELVLAKYGNEVVTKHMDLLRLADCIVDIYAMTAVLGRASRSYCIGLQNSDYEMIIANSFCLNAMERVKENIQKIYLGPFNTNDENYSNISKKMFKSSGKYYLQHPLTKNF